MILRLQLLALAAGFSGWVLHVPALFFLGGSVSLFFVCKSLYEGYLHPFLVVFVFGYFIFTEGSAYGLMYSGLANLTLGLTLVPLLKRYFETRERKKIEAENGE